MDLNFTEEQDMLRRTARQFLERECPTSLVREMEADPRGVHFGLWKQSADLGLMGVALPERYGGGGQSFLDLALVLEEFGRAMMPGPVLQTLASCGMSLLEFGTDDQRQQFLPGIASGETLMGLAFIEPGTGYEETNVSTSVRSTAGDFTLNGTKLFVPYAGVLDFLLVVGRSHGDQLSKDGLTLLLADARGPGIQKEELKVRGRDRVHEVRFVDAKVPQDGLIGEEGNGWPVLERLLALSAGAQCAEIAGVCGAVSDITTEYAKSRAQFGRPIGMFQAIQRHCGDMHADTEAVRYLTYDAAWRLGSGVPAEKEVGMAKSFASDAVRRVMESGHQVHGAIGLTDEHDLTLYNRRSTALAVNYGDSTFHRETVASNMGL